MTPAEKLSDALKKQRTPKRKVLYTCRLKGLREALGLKPVDICRATGVANSSYHYIEQGCELSLDYALKLSKFFGVSVNDIWVPIDG